MVHIVTGKINDRKTTHMLALYERLGGDGFVSLKTMNKDVVHSYTAKRLSTGESRLLIVRDVFMPEGFDACDKIGPYHFAKDCVKWIESTLTSLVEKEVEPLFLDEVGILEMRGQGFAKTVKIMVDSGLDVYFTVRRHLLPDFLKQYDIIDYYIIEGENDGFGH